MIRWTVSGEFKTPNFLEQALKLDFDHLLGEYAEQGLRALVSATPVRTGKTAASWSYSLIKSPNRYALVYKNSNRTNNNDSIVILLDYGHGNGRGYWVEGRHFIEPAIRPIFDKIAEKAWKEVIKH